MSTIKDEIKLLERIRSGDERALEQLFNHWYGYLYKIAFSMLHDAEPAKDAVQEVFIRFWQKREELDINSTLKGYLQRSIVNQCLSVLRLKQIFVEASDEPMRRHDPAPSPSDQLHVNTLEQIIHEAIDRLPEQRRIIFRMSRMEELNHREIADLLQLSPKTVENQIGKALRTLRAELGPWLSMLPPLLFLAGA